MYKCTSGWLSTHYTVCLLYIIIVVILECTNVHLAGYLHSTQCACCTSLLWLYSMYKCASGWLFTQYTVCLLYIIIVVILDVQMCIWLAIFTVHSVLVVHHYCSYIRMYKCTSGCLNIIIVVIFECTNVHLAGYLHSTQCA